MKRSASILLVISLAMAASVGEASQRPRSQPGADAEYTYIAANPGVMVLLGNHPGWYQTEAGRLAPLGYFAVRASGPTLRLQVDDHAAEGLRVPVTISRAHWGEILFEKCVSVGTSTSFDLGSVRTVFVRVGPFYDLNRTCSGTATAGTVNVADELPWW